MSKLPFSRRTFLNKCAIGMASLAFLDRLNNNVYGNSKKKPNILWLIAEDLSQDLGCYGDQIVKTPNMDKLASEGARYTNAFATSTVCSPSRSAFMTGMYQTTIGAHHHRSHRDDGYVLPKPVEVITSYFRKAGYFTSCCQDAEWKRPGKTDFNFTLSKTFDGTDWRQRKSGQPFFAQVNFNETHRVFANDHENPVDPNKVTVPPYYPDHPITRKDWANYLECIQVLDKKVGQVLKRLEEDGLADNTLVFFFADHGRPHVRDKEFLYDGGIRVPLIIRWPGHIRPGSVVDDMISAIDFGPTCLSFAGIKPPSHMQGRVFMGKGALKRKHIFAARDRCGSTFDRIRCVQTKKFKYIRNFYPQISAFTQSNCYKRELYPVLTLMEVLWSQGKLTPEQAQFMSSTRPKEELYDLQNDPHQIYNLAGDAKYRAKLNELADVLDKWIRETNDQGEIPEDPKIAAYWHNIYYHRDLCKKMKARGLAPDCSPAEYLKFWEKELLSDKPSDSKDKDTESGLRI